jgi:hypothetical protein
MSLAGEPNGWITLSRRNGVLPQSLSQISQVPGAQVGEGRPVRPGFGECRLEWYVFAFGKPRTIRPMRASIISVAHSATKTGLERGSGLSVSGRGGGGRHSLAGTVSLSLILM